LHDFPAIAPVIRKLGARHVGYGANPRHYATIGETLLWTLARGLGAAFDPELRSAWVKVYELLAKTMQAGADVTEHGTGAQAIALTRRQ
jgi:nitric oxide dioxygenase